MIPYVHRLLDRSLITLFRLYVVDGDYPFTHADYRYLATAYTPQEGERDEDR